jgi:hypothetical protein
MASGNGTLCPNSGKGNAGPELVGGGKGGSAVSNPPKQNSGGKK